MLNQTLPHFFFQLNPSSFSSPLFSSSAAPSLLLSPSSSSSYSKLKTQEEMECVGEIKALKTSFWSETTMKSNNPQVIWEDFLGVNGGNGVVSGDDLFVEGLLDFSNEDVGVGFVEEEEEEEKESISASSSCSSSSSQQEEKYYSCGEFSVKDEPLYVPDSELGVPADDLADLEWLSHFVEDSFSEFSLQHVAGIQPEKTQSPKQSRRCEARPIGFLTSFPAKARSKRSRTGGRVWSLGLLPSSESSSSSSSSSPVSPSSSSSCLINSTGENLDALNCIGKLAAGAKRQKKKTATELQQRRCSHCGVQKTPQWRTGPKGAKTLCNACGVRYKSGRLLPEYRPACSPTFSNEVHSNNHRKVLEMRRKKETGLREPDGGRAGLAPPVQSY